MANTKNSGTTTSPSKGQVIVTYYGVEYTVKVDGNLTKSIKSIMFEANRGSKGYKTPTLERIMTVLEDKGFVYYLDEARTERRFRANVNRKKLEFKQKSDGACNMPFICLAS
jgi:hypothetical protein|tara:strand:+ start:1068 stop:1403 length:336 start_codon:yes stop_codon:yes gene_type:complete